MAKIIKGNFPKQKSHRLKGGSRQTEAVGYRLKIVLAHIAPPVWRLVEVPAALSLAGLHEVIQLAMGWTDTHMHQFLVGATFYGPADLIADWGEVGALDEAHFRLCDLEQAMKQRFLYEYDFGDGWQHDIAIDRVLGPDETPPAHARLLDGGRACPPEDVGGPPGYLDFLAAMGDPDHAEHEDAVAWYDGDRFDPEYFDKEAPARFLARIR